MPGGSDGAQPSPIVKSSGSLPPTEMPRIRNGAPPVFRTATEVAGADSPIGSSANTRASGAAFTAG
jgi:hypothetical protein